MPFNMGFKSRNYPKTPYSMRETYIEGHFFLIFIEWNFCTDLQKKKNVDVWAKNAAVGHF